MGVLFIKTPCDTVVYEEDHRNNSWQQHQKAP